MKAAFLYHSLRRDISNFSMIKNRGYDGFLVSMHQSGTHWLKHMLATALTGKYDLPPPQYNHANDVIGGPKDAAADSSLPRLVNSHSIPHALLRSRLFRLYVKFPPYIVLVRDIRASLVSNYEKWKQHYRCDFNEYLRGDISGHRFNNDIWWCLRFCNSWGFLAQRFPATTLIVRYEDLRSDTLHELKRIDTYWQLGLDETELVHAIEESSKKKMAEKVDPDDTDAPFGVKMVREARRSYLDWYDEEQSRYLSEICDKYLKYDFTYNYSDPAGSNPQPSVISADNS